MITILKGTSVEVHWRIIRTENKITEDFTGAELRVFLVGPDNVYPLECGVEAVDGYNEIRFAVNSKGLSTGVYDLKAVWVKNKHSIPDVVNNQFMLVSRRGGVLAVTNDPSEATMLPLDKTIKLMSYVESYGRDGMSAYELAAFRGVLPEGMSEAEWAGQENVRMQNEEQREDAEDARREAEDNREDNERLREQGEAARVSAETARKAAEGVREATFQTNEATREATFQTNEAAREAEFGKAIQAAKDNLVVVNNLTTGGADKALSAEMGKELQGNITLVESDTYSNMHGKNLFDKSSAIKGYFISISGKPSANEDYFYSDYIPVKPESTYYINKKGNGAYYLILDANKDIIIKRAQQLGTIQIPSNGYYLVVSSMKVDIDSLQVEEGDKETAYQPFYSVNDWYEWYRYTRKIVGGDLYEEASNIAVPTESYSSGFMNSKGNVFEDSNYVTSDFIEIPFECVGIEVMGSFSNPYGGGLCFYDSNKSYISSIYNVGVAKDRNELYEIELSKIPSNASFIRCCALKSYSFGATIYTIDESSVVSYLMTKAHSVQQDLVEQRKTINDLNNEVSSLTKLKGKNLFNKATATLGEFFSGSSIGTNAKYFCSDYMPVRAGDTYHINKDGVGGYYVIYAEDKSIIRAASQKVGAITIPEGGCYLRVSTTISNLDSLQVEEGDKETAYEEYYEADIRDAVRENTKDVTDIKDRVVPKLCKKESYAESFSAGDYLEIPNTPNLKNKHSISFHANVSAMGKLRMSHGTAAHAAGILEVDETNLYVYSCSSPSTIIDTAPHGLSISEYIHIQLKVADAFHKGTVILSTGNGESFSKEITWNGCSLNATVNCISGSYSKAKIIFGGSAWKENVWIFGDSYTDSWPGYMEGLQATSYLLDGHSGRGSTDAYSSFVNELEYGVPSVVVWMMGMNNPDTSDAISSSYKTYFDKMKMFCESRGIFFVPCTIPNVPARIHALKNQYIKENSQYYIDMAKVLGAEEVASSWYTGLLSTDNVHPTAAGAKLIAQTLCEEMPQILND